MQRGPAARWQSPSLPAWAGRAQRGKAANDGGDDGGGSGGRRGVAAPASALVPGPSDQTAHATERVSEPAAGTRRREVTQKAPLQREAAAQSSARRRNYEFAKS